MVWISEKFYVALLAACVILISASADSQTPATGTQSQQSIVEQGQSAPSNPDAADKDQHTPHAEKNSAEKSPLPTSTKQPVGEGLRTTLDSSEDKEKADWWSKFWYEIKVTDVAISIFSGLLVLVTIGLFWATWKTANAAQETANVAKLSLETIEAPHLEVVDHEIRIFPEAAHDRMYPGSAPPPEIDLFFFNTGRSTAVIQSIRREMFVVSGTDRLRQPVFSGKSGHSNGRTVTAANTKTLAFTCRFDRSLTAEELQGIRSDDVTVFILGELIYDDSLNWQHKYNFLLAYDRVTKSMVAVGTDANKHTKKKK